MLRVLERHDIDIDENAACIVFLADLHVVELACLAKVAGSDCGHVHQVEALGLAAKILAHLQVQVHCTFDVFLDEGLFDLDVFQFRSEGSVPAVVAPVGVQDAEFSLIGIAAFLGKILYHFGEVILVHRQPHLLAICLEFLSLHGTEAFQNRDRCHGCMLCV